MLVNLIIYTVTGVRASFDLLGMPDTSFNGLSTLAALRAFKLPALKTWSCGKLRRLQFNDKLF